MNKPVDKLEARWKPNPKLTRKENALVHHMVTNPKESATKAVQATYNTKNANVAAVMAHELTHKPTIMAELAKYSNEAEMTLIEVMTHSRQEMYSGDKEAVQWAVNARQTADSLLDRLHGKATQRTENATLAVTLNVDLTSAA